MDCFYGAATSRHKADIWPAGFARQPSFQPFNACHCVLGLPMKKIIKNEANTYSSQYKILSVLLVGWTKLRVNAEIERLEDAIASIREKDWSEGGGEGLPPDKAALLGSEI